MGDERRMNGAGSAWPCLIGGGLLALGLVGCGQSAGMSPESNGTVVASKPEGTAPIPSTHPTSDPKPASAPVEAPSPVEPASAAPEPAPSTPPASVTDQSQASAAPLPRATPAPSTPPPAASSSSPAETPVVVPKAGSVPPAVIPEPPPLEPREMKLLVPERQLPMEKGAVRVSFDDLDLLKVLDAEPVPLDVLDHFPKWLSELDGKTIRLKGWMFPPPRETDLPAFLFVRDNQICCFGRRPKVYDKLGVIMKEGATTNYIQGHPFDVIGTLKYKARVINGELDFLYTIVDAQVVDQK